MVKLTVHMSETEVRFRQEQELLDQMIEAIATTKMLRQFCNDLHALVDQVPAEELQRLLERIEAHSGKAVKHLIKVHTALMECEASSPATASVSRTVTNGQSTRECLS